jgi:hypothetical protein
MPRAHLTALVSLAFILDAGGAGAQTVAFVAPGEDPPGEASRAVLRCHELLEAVEGVEVLESAELRRALAGLPARPPGAGGASVEAADDPLADVRRFAERAQGDQRRPSLTRLGERIDVDLLVTVRLVGSELELRAFDTERGAFYRGTLMIPALSPPEGAELAAFVQPRAAAAAAATPGEAAAAEEPAERPRSARRHGRWWIWVLVGSAAAAAILVGVLATPREVEDTGVTVRIVAP